MNTRLLIERKPLFQVEVKTTQEDWRHTLNIDVPSLRIVMIYDIFDISDSVLNKSLQGIFSDPAKDIILDSSPKTHHQIVIEPLPGQFDQRADSAMQCLKLIDGNSKAIVRSAMGYFFNESLTNSQLNALKQYTINPVESREKVLSKLELSHANQPKEIPIWTNFITLNQSDLKSLYKAHQLAMTFDDFCYVQSYFKSQGRNPYETEIKVLDTYWSDHCRHTTFETELTQVSFQDDPLSKEIEKTYNDYLKTRQSLNIKKPIRLMDLAIINAQLERQNGHLDDLEISEEVNAASIEVDVVINGQPEKWMLMFKNETHNHPTEIEPFGGASTCIGGAIRDPLSGRSYVYGAMRVTGAADITAPIEDTLEGKLPQRVISKQATLGYASYGNQIGLPTSYVEELYHPGYVAKRMEIGAVIGAVKKSHLKRETPSIGDVILVLGGRTGRDGIGGATGSSKSHTESSKDLSASEVQKGNAPEERKIQRLFRNPDIARLIKKSNDFGAGGVCVAIGELAPGIHINLNALKTKYDGINGTELAISESQERMAVVLDPNDVSAFIKGCHDENIEVTHVADVIETNALIMTYNDQTICHLDRTFLDSAGVRQTQTVMVPKQSFSLKQPSLGPLKDALLHHLEDLNVASQKGLAEHFDASIGRTTVLNPYGGDTLLTKAQSSVHTLPVQADHTSTVSIMSYGFDPYLTEQSPYLGSIYAVIESMAKHVATGGNHHRIRFTFQEYFERLNQDPIKWGKPLSALLGTYRVLKAFNLAAVGGKDSMSGTYHSFNVPPTLVSFAVSTGDINHITSPEFKQPSNYLYVIDYPLNSDLIPDFNVLNQNFEYIHHLIQKNIVHSAHALSKGGLSEAVFKSAFGNMIGATIDTELPMFDKRYGAILIETDEPITYQYATLIGQTKHQPHITINGTVIPLNIALTHHLKTFNDIYPIQSHIKHPFNPIPSTPNQSSTYPNACDQINVLFPIFPGTNCEYDSMEAFAHDKVQLMPLVFNNQTKQDIDQSIDALVKGINQAHIIMLSGGFSSGDEPDGSGKFIASVLRHNTVKNAIHRFLNKQHLILGICNGFQALVQSGLLPHGQIKRTNHQPVLYKNTINRHMATFVKTRVSSTASPWLRGFKIGDTHHIPISHTEGNFYVDDALYQSLVKHDQIAFQYADSLNQASDDPAYNPNGSRYAIEGIISPDGLILGKMGHSERYKDGLFKNVPGNKHQDIFKNGIDYFLNGGKQ
jgi:phosphoribosylformylglycinamidine synthase